MAMAQAPASYEPDVPPGNLLSDPTTCSNREDITEHPIPPQDDSPAIFDEAKLERLGRQRPDTLRNALTESCFVLTMLLSMMMSEFYVSGFNIILPSVALELDIPDAVRTWPAAVPNLSTAALLLPFSRLGDIYGARGVFLTGHAWTLVWSVAAGFSKTPNMLIIFRALQGVGFAAFLPTGLTLLASTYRPGPRKNLVFSLYGSFSPLGFYFGIFTGSVSGEYLTWRWYFWTGAFFILAVVILGVSTIPCSVDTVNPEAKMDWLGTATIVPGLALVVYALTDGGHAPQGWRTPYIYVTLIIGAILLCLAVYIQGWVSEQPLMPPAVFHQKYMKRLSIVLFSFYGVFGLYLFFASYYLENVLGTTPILAAAWFTPMAVGGIILAIAGGLILHILPGKLLMTISGIGFLLSGLLFAVIPAQSESGQSRSFIYWAYVFPAMICSTIGIDITYTVTNIFITTSMPRKSQAAASGLINSLLYLGMAFWLGIGELAVSTVKNARHGDLTPRQQYRIGFWTAVGLASSAIIIMMTIKFGKASSELTTDEKADLARELEMREPESGRR
ncbi:drug resistance protein [Emericellopsis atlantica]|uniref:Drug resistance protein n=1 Tax=Emericellopsis atlantica TaxID=2614577 RepID=A0A9P7ZFZ1_9HYPO|nr:drug resistance protein [Emericellopsis atlantica]KAG9251122.1 drug resistance protein [Emericellopsis atlantica]